MIKLATCAPEKSHPSVHLTWAGIIPRCRHKSWGEEKVPVEVVAEVATDDFGEARKALSAAGVSPCRMCRRCWKDQDIPAHDRVACFGRRSNS